MIDPAEEQGSENNRVQERGHRKTRGKGKVGESSLMKLFQFKKSTVVTLKKDNTT